MSAFDDSNQTTASTSNILHIADVASSQRDFYIWQQATVMDLSPVIVLDVLYLAFGVIGNSIVCYICMFRMPQTVINSFVLSLAILELLGCIFTIPVDITELVNTYSFNYPILCKSEKYFRKVIIFSTGCILIAIATERYKCIVKPYSRKMTLYQFQIAIIGATVFSAILAIPEAVLAGSETVSTSFGEGVVCSVYHSDVYSNSVFPIVWGLMVVLLYVISIAWITTIYVMIALTIWRRVKVHTDRRSRTNTPDSTLRRRLRCHSYNQERTCELDTRGRSLTSFDLQFKVQQRYLSACLANETNNSTSSISFGSSDLKDIGIQGKPSELTTYTQDKCILNSEENNQRIPFTDENEGNFIDENQPNNSTDMQLHKNMRFEDKQDRDYHDNSFTNENDDESSFPCINNVSHHDQFHTLNKKNKNHQNGATESVDFFNAFIKKFYENELQDWTQDYSLYLRPGSQTALQSVSSKGSFHRKTGYSRKRTTFMMFVITMTTAISHLPHIVVMLYSLVYPGVTAKLSADQSVIFQVAWNSFFISLAFHPFMYGFWNGRFKSALYSLFTGLKQTKIKTERGSFSSGRHS